MTYRELLEQLQNLTEEQLADDIVVYDSSTSEFLPASGVEESQYDDVLPKKHLYLTV